MSKLNALLTGGALALIGASASALDYSGAASAATTEINSAMSAALPVGIVVMAAVIGWRLFKRFAKG